jgi:hypothetical protein
LDEKVDPWNFVMPILYVFLHCLMNSNPDVRCVVSGTNFFAPLVVDTGHAYRSSFISMDGTFLPDWVMKNLVQKYFQIPPAFGSSAKSRDCFESKSPGYSALYGRLGVVAERQERG